MSNTRLLLIVSGSVAAYKSLELVRRLRDHGIGVTAILTRGGQEFITPLALSSLTGNPTYTDLFSLKDEVEMGHIRLSREADLVLVAPASADIIAKMAAGLTDDLATATLLASDKPVLVAPAMNAQMWTHPATQRNLRQIQKDGAILVPPGSGELACGEIGQGRMAEVETLLEAVLHHCNHPKQQSTHAPLAGYSALVTAGPTFEPLDPVRYIGNRSSGKQGYAIAEALRDAGAAVTLVSGPTALPAPHGVQTVAVETAEEMLAACKRTLPADIAICAAAVADWKAATHHPQKLKKSADACPPEIALTPNPDILHYLATLKKNRPALVIGFAAETEQLKKHARRKLKAKNCDGIVANDVSDGRVFGQDTTSAWWITADRETHWETLSKQALATKLTTEIIERITRRTTTKPKAKRTHA